MESTLSQREVRQWLHQAMSSLGAAVVNAVLNIKVACQKKQFIAYVSFAAERRLLHRNIPSAQSSNQYIIKITTYKDHNATDSLLHASGATARCCEIGFAKCNRDDDSQVTNLCLSARWPTQKSRPQYLRRSSRVIFKRRKDSRRQSVAA